MQEALLAAATTWPTDGVPDSPLGWLVRVASRRMADLSRSAESRRRREDLAASWSREPPEAAPGRDDTLALFFMCCHPALTPSSAVALTLRALGGLTTREIAAAFLVPEATMAQRISRAKRTVAESGEPLALPDARARTAAPRARAPRGLPRLQRGVHVERRSEPGPHRPRLGGHPSRPPAPRAAARRTGGDGAPRAHAADRGAPPGAHRARRLTGPPGRPGPLPLGPRPRHGGHRVGHHCARARAGGRVRPPGGGRRAARRGAPPRGHRLGADPLALLGARADDRQPRGAAEPGRRRGDGRGTRRRTGAPRRAVRLRLVGTLAPRPRRARPPPGAEGRRARRRGRSTSPLPPAPTTCASGTTSPGERPRLRTPRAARLSGSPGSPAPPSPPPATPPARRPG